MRQILALLLCIGITATAQAACRVEPRGVVPVDAVDGHIMVTVAVNDVAATFILDTGADRTLMGEDVVRRLGVERDGWVASTVRGIAGIEERPNALPRSLRLGATLLRRRTITGDTSVTVGPLPVNEIAGRPIAGLLGRDFLSPFDLDLDLPEHRMTLYDVRGCDARFLPWTSPYAAIPATTPMGAALVVPVLIDGRPLRALIDSGASASLITAPGIYRLGLTPGAVGARSGWQRQRGRTGTGTDAASPLRRIARRPRHHARSDALGCIGARGADRRHAAWRGLVTSAARVVVVRDQTAVRGCPQLANFHVGWKPDMSLRSSCHPRERGDPGYRTGLALGSRLRGNDDGDVGGRCGTRNDSIDDRFRSC